MKLLSHVCWLFATPWTVAYEAPLSMGFSRHEYWSGLPFPSPLDFRTKLKKWRAGGGIDKWKKLFLLSYPHHVRMRNGQSTTRKCRVIRDPEWICIVFRKVELITLKEENETKVSYTIFSTPPLFLSLEMENEPEDLLFIFHIFSLRSCVNLHGQEIWKLWFPCPLSCLELYEFLTHPPG